MAQSHIEWTEMTWNPTTGCNKVSAGCKHCYAEIMTRRLKAMGVDKYKDGFKIKTHQDALDIPYSWKSSKVVFVNSMSDLFHKDVPLSFIKQVFDVMNNNPQHVFQVLTKRSDILLKFSNSLKWTHNIWMGVSVENEDYTFRIDELSKTAAKTKFLSIEPLIGPVKTLNLEQIDWVIVGGEAGHKARPVKKKWIEFVQAKCTAENVAFFFKQWGKAKFNDNPFDPTIDAQNPQHAKGGCQLNGEVYRQMPNLAVLAL